MGPPPESLSSIDAISTIKISPKRLLTDSHCPICRERFELGSEVSLTPCNHIYHSNCILPWLVQHNSCPVCRHKLPSQGSINSQNSSSSVSTNTSGLENNWENQGRPNFSPSWPFQSPNSNTRYSESGRNSSAATYEVGHEINYSGWPFDY